VHKLLLDQGLARTAAAVLRERGFDAIHVGELGLALASDKLILELARKEGRLVCTLDADFHASLALTGEASPSVIRIRVEGLRGPALAALLERVLEETGPALTAGAAVTVRTHSVRVRRLPLGKVE